MNYVALITSTEIVIFMAPSQCIAGIVSWQKRLTVLVPR